MTKRLLRDERGFTLPELLVTCIIALTVSLAAFSLLDFVMRRSGEVSVRVETTQRGRTAMDQMTRALRSQVCAWRSDTVMPGARSLYDASPTSVTFFTDYTNESTSAAPVLRTLSFTDGTYGGTITESTTAGTWSGGQVTYAGATATNRQVLATAVLYQSTKDPSGTATPLFRYYRFPTADELDAMPAGTTPQPDIEVGAGRALTADELESIARISVMFRVLPLRNRNKSDYKGSQVLQNDIYVRTADPNAETPSPTCATT